MISSLINTILLLCGKMGYWGVFFLMTLESTFIPIPSELVIPPAAYLASQGKMNLLVIIILAILGSLFGALINYFLGMTLGRAIIYALARKKIARLFFISEDKIKKAENYFVQYGNISTFLGRFIPGIRHLISIPAGMSKMSIWNFILFTFLGAGIWCTFLALVGYYFGENQEKIISYADDISMVAVIIAIGIGLCYFWRWRKKKINRVP